MGHVLGGQHALDSTAPEDLKQYYSCNTPLQQHMPVMVVHGMMARLRTDAFLQLRGVVLFRVTFVARVGVEAPTCVTSSVR
jgi:hypothetical protein